MRIWNRFVDYVDQLSDAERVSFLLSAFGIICIFAGMIMAFGFPGVVLFVGVALLWSA